MSSFYVINFLKSVSQLWDVKGHQSRIRFKLFYIKTKVHYVTLIRHLVNNQIKIPLLQSLPCWFPVYFPLMLCVFKPNYPGGCKRTLSSPPDISWRGGIQEEEELQIIQWDWRVPPSQHGTFGFINRRDYRPGSLMFCSCKDRHLFWKVINDHPALATKCRGMLWLWRMLLVWTSVRGSGALAAPWGSGCGINSRARLAGMGIVQSYLQTTLALLFIVPVSRLLFLPAVTSEERRATETVG